MVWLIPSANFFSYLTNRGREGEFNYTTLTGVYLPLHRAGASSMFCMSMGSIRFFVLFSITVGRYRRA
jgi:hypothetical protein